MKSDDQRGNFGAWLRRERLARFPNVPKAVAAVQREAGYGVPPSVWAELEAGSRRPSQDQRERLTRYFGSEPAPIANGDGDIAAALRELVEEVRLARLASETQAGTLAELLGVVLEGRLPQSEIGAEGDAPAHRGRR